MVCDEIEVAIPEYLNLWPDFKVTLRRLSLRPNVELDPSCDSGRPNLLELTRAMFEEEKRPTRVKEEAGSKFMEAPCGANEAISNISGSALRHPIRIVPSACRVKRVIRLGACRSADLDMLAMASLAMCKEIKRHAKHLLS